MTQKSRTKLDPEALQRALVPLYARRVAPETLCVEAVERLSRVLGAEAQLTLPDSLGGRVIGEPPNGGSWTVEFRGPDDEGRLTVAGGPPSSKIVAALEVELDRFARYLEVRQAVAADLDRLEFRLQALHQISRTLSIARKIPDAEAHIVDFTGELFFAWWTALYRPLDPGTLEPREVRSLADDLELPEIAPSDLAGFLPVGDESEAIVLDDPPDWLPVGTRALATLDMGGRRLGCLLLGERMTEERYRPEDLQLLSTLAHSSAIALRNAELMAELREKAIMDELTGLYNRRFFESRLNEEIDRARRYRRPVSLILLDLDEFKSYNDTYGHAAGDVLLSRIGALIRANTRNVDLACRYGGEEFTVIAPETTRTQAEGLAERLHRGIGGLAPVTGVHRRVTVSAGVACFPDDARDAGSLLEAADRALYRAKAEGRDRVVSA